MRDLARYWNVTAEERTAAYPCNRFMHAPYEAFLRAVDVDGPPEWVIFSTSNQPNYSIGCGRFRSEKGARGILECLAR